ncbi:MAG: hypothetical protein JW954_01500 [Dehalococcoidaceae bacterium]|nr:hypothetical protein [Dehalococcoidaceae bacterium]
MAEELGRITKPEAEQFKAGRRLFLVPLLFEPPSPPEELKGIIQRYWEEARRQINGLEARIGSVNCVYHEMIASADESGLKNLQPLNTHSYHLARSMVERGARFMAIEDGELLSEYMDWGRCLSAGLFSHKVLTSVLNSYQEAQNRRNQSMAARLEESLASDEIGLLIISENHHIQFPADIEVFYVAPPALDEFKRWLRRQESEQPGPQPGQKPPASGKSKESRTDSQEKNNKETAAEKNPRPVRKSRKKGAG